VKIVALTASVFADEHAGRFGYTTILGAL